MASAKTGNETSLMRAISAVYRPAALFLTNKENFVVSDGDYAGTQINSSNMLWSLSGNIALVYKVLFGMHYNENSLQFKPFVPKGLGGKRILSNFKYRDAVFNISMEGYGNQALSVLLDGKIALNGLIPANLKGTHTVQITLINKVISGKSSLQPDYTAPETPAVKYTRGNLSWDKIPGAVSYYVLKNGKRIAISKANTFAITANKYAVYQVAAADANGVPSFNSEPVDVIPANAAMVIEAENNGNRSGLKYEGFTGDGFVEISTSENKTLNIPLVVAEDGAYAIDFRYANGNGPINTENKCAIRTLDVDKDFAGTIVLPQRGKGEWSNWGYTNPVKVKLLKGKHSILLQLKGANENMNG
jgi:hypothetical protein